MIRRISGRWLRPALAPLFWAALLCAFCSAAATAQANAIVTTTTLSVRPTRATVGQRVIYTARISPNPGGGTLAFASDGVVIPGCGAAVLAAGESTCATTFNAPGSHQSKVAYSGNALFAPSQSLSLAESVRSSLRLERVLSATADRFIVRLRCAVESGGCRATGRLSATHVLLGSKSSRIAAGKTRILRIDLANSGKALLARRGKLTVKVEIALIKNGTRSIVATRERILDAPNPILAVTGPEVISYARRFTGVPYVYGGNGPNTFDCSGFTSYVYAHFGYHLARTAYYQMQQGRPVIGPLRAGDLIFWDGGGHVGIYVGNQSFISATVHRGIWTYSFQVWTQTQSYTTARRILGRPTAGWPATAASWMPRNGGPADATPQTVVAQ